MLKCRKSFDVFTLARTIESCLLDVNWVCVGQNKLQLNDDKAEILLVGSVPGIDLQYVWVRVTSQ